MYLIKKLSWFFKLEWKRYTIGIIALSLVSAFNLIPPRVIGEVVDSIDLKTLTISSLLWNLLLLLLSAVAMYTNTLQACLQASIKSIALGT